MAVGSCCKKFMETNTQPLNKRHAAPNLGIVAIIFTLLFNGSVLPVTAFGGLPHFPGPWASAVLICAFLQFGGSIALGIYTVQLRQISLCPEINVCCRLCEVFDDRSFLGKL